MPTLRLTTQEAAALTRKRARDKAHNAVVAKCVDKVKGRLKKADPLETALIQAVLQDLRRVMR